MNIKKGDTVVIISGNYKGKKGKVNSVLLGRERIIVEGVNIVRRHTRPVRRGEPGGILEKEAPIHHSNVMFVCPSCGEPTRLGRTELSDGSSVRYCKKCNEIVE